ncbi:MAG: sodium:solute symporter family protein, partial [Vicinamibacterales bacterium]
LVGFAIALPIALHWFGGWEALRAVNADVPRYWTFAGTDALKYIALFAPAFVVSPGLLQKIFGAENDRAVRVGVGFNALGLLLFAGVPMLLGIMARSKFPEIAATSNMALPMIFMQGLPPLAGAVALAAVFSAEVSAADAVLFMLTTSFSQDLYKRFVNPAADDTRVLLVARLATVVSGALGVWLALYFGDLVETLKIFYALLGVSLFVPIIAGLYVRRANADAAIAGIIGGVGGMLVVQGATGGTGFGLLGPAPAGLLAAALGWAISMVFAPRPAR